MRLANPKSLQEALAWVCAMALATPLTASPASAQIAGQTPPTVITPLTTESDQNEVNIPTGQTRIGMPGLSIPAAPRLRVDQLQNVMPYLSAKVGQGGSGYVESSVSVNYGGSSSESFSCINDDVCTNHKGNGSTLDGAIAAGGPYSSVLAPSGAVYTFNRLSYDSGGTGTRSLIYFASQVAYPDGEIISYTYQTASYPSGQGAIQFRVAQMTSNSGYQINFSYQGNDVNYPAWRTPSQISLYKSTNLTNPLAQLTYSASGTVIDLIGRTYTCAGCDFRVGGQVELSSASVTLPGEAGAAKTVSGTVYNYAFPAMVTSVNRDGITWSYAYTNFRAIPSPSGYGYDKVTVTGPEGYQQVYNIEVGTPKQPNRISSIVDPLGRITSYSYDTSFRPVQVVYPEGNSVQIAYDARGNIVSKIYNPKPGSGLVAKSEAAAIDTAACAASRVQCYRITSFTDAMGRVTNYAYDAAGRLVQQTDPADANGVRRARFLSYGSSFTSPVEVRVCGLGTTCGTSAEFKTQYTYLGSTPLALSETAIDGATGATIVNTYTYDEAGRLLIADGPLAGTGDAKYFRYDAVGRKTWEIGPADTTGLRPATRYTYRPADDRATMVETGTVSDPYSATLTVLTQVNTAYDSRRNPVQIATSAGGTTYSITNASFDGRNRPVCSAVRMNPAAFGSLPADACALGAQGGQGPDRITRNVYDAAGQLLQIQRGVGTSIQQNYVTYTYSANGKQASVTDANGNLATYAYDGFDNLVRWTFPSQTTPGQVNPADYESYTYDAVGNRTAQRKRDGSVIQFNFDQLNRVISKIVPERAGLDPSRTRDVYYGYDMRGLQLFARFDSPSGEGVTYTYDGFGRPTSETKSQNGGWVLGSGYDAAGNRTSFSYADGQSTGASYDNLNRPTAIWRYGAYIAVYGYNTAMQRSWQDNANGMRTDYIYDALGRISAFSNNFYNNPGQGAWNNLYTFSRNSAGQLTARTQSNDVFAWTNHVNVDRPYTINGLNQYTTAGSLSITYDANGNLTSDGTTTYTYDPENRLVAASGAKNAQLYYDPLGRLHAVTGSTGTTYFVWDGNALAMEYNSAGQVLRRYAHGRNVIADDPIAWYEGATMDGSTERWLRTDERGSIVAVSNATLVLTVNSYDEYGIPQSNNVGRFQYTGQVWIAELGLYHYKARFYSPTLGRFLQTDPIGYGDQANLYTYVGNDPINGVDPSGLARVCTAVTGSTVPACVDVDGNGDGNVKDNDLSSSQKSKIASDFYTAIVDNRGKDISSYGKTVSGPGADADKEMTRVSSQFFGASLARGKIFFADMAMRSAWKDLQYIWVGKNPKDASIPAWNDGEKAMGIDPGSRWFKAGPSNIARMIAHELMDWGVGDPSFLYPIHMYNDMQARDFVKRNGLGGGGCLSNEPFPGC